MDRPTRNWLLPLHERRVNAHDKVSARGKLIRALIRSTLIEASYPSAHWIQTIPTTVVSWYRQVSINNSYFNWIWAFITGSYTAQQFHLAKEIIDNHYHFYYVIRGHVILWITIVLLELSLELKGACSVTQLEYKADVSRINSFVTANDDWLTLRSTCQFLLFLFSPPTWHPSFFTN